MKKNDTIAPMTPLWYGKPKYHYKVFKNNILFYSCTSIAKNQIEILQAIVERFKGDSSTYKIYCNGTLTEVVNKGVKSKAGRKKKYHWSNPS